MSRFIKLTRQKDDSKVFVNVECITTFSEEVNPLLGESGPVYTNLCLTDDQFLTVTETCEDIQRLLEVSDGKS